MPTIHLNSAEWTFDEDAPLGPPGGFGEVFRGSGASGPVAIKRLKLTASEAAHREMFTQVAAPVMTRLRQPERLVLDTLVEAGVARSRSDALAWCVRLVGRHEGDWLAELREAMVAVDDVRRRGPAA